MKLQCRRIILGLLLGIAMARLSAQENAEAIRAHAQRAKEALAANKLAEASQEYRSILALDPTNAGVYTALGVTLYGMGQPGEALSALESALKLDASQTRAQLFLALSEAAVGRCADASPTLQRQLDGGSEPRLQRLAGMSLLDCDVALGRLPAAEAASQRLGELFPDDPDVLYKQAELYTQLWNRAADTLMRRHPESYRVHQLGGEVYAAQGKTDQAMKEYRLALAENPRVPELHARIGQLLLHEATADSEQAALGEFQAELSVNPQSAISEYSMGEIYRHQRKLDDALTHYERASEMDPAMADAFVGQAQVLLAQHQLERCRVALDKAIREQPDNATAHYTLMMAYREQGNLADAGKELAVFQRLQQESSRKFDDKLHSLLSGKPAEGESRP